MKKVLLIITILLVCFISGCYAKSKNELYYALEHSYSYSYVDEVSASNLDWGDVEGAV